MKFSGGSRGGQGVTTQDIARRRPRRVNGAAHSWLAAREDDVWEDPPDNRVELPLESLAPDCNGEIVLQSQADLTAIGIATSETVVRSGTMPYRHLTATGLDVSGYRFVRFDSGLTLYYPQRITLTVTPQPA